MVEPSPVCESSGILKAMLLGRSEIAVGDRVVGAEDWPGRLPRTLLLLLLVTPGYRLPRDQVLDRLWPEAAPEAALNSLYKTLHALRRVLEPDLARGNRSAYIAVGGDGVGLVDPARVWVDAHAFASAVASAAPLAEPERRAALRAALDLYAGDLLADEPYLDWLVARREGLRTTRERVVLDLAVLDLAAGEPLAALGPLFDLLGSDPTVEEAHRAAMRAYAAAGQREAALRQFERCRSALEADLGAEPSPETIALRDEIASAQVRLDGIDRNATKPRPFNNLPAPPTPLVGRDAEVDEIQALLWRPDVRLVTLTGAGGIGKTRLALEIAAGVADDFPDGVVFVSFAALRDPELVIQAIAQTMGIREEAGRSIETLLQEVLKERDLLLVLDNMEHLLDAAPSVAELLAVCGRVTALATSREALMVRAEHERELRPLGLPNLKRLPPSRSLPRYGAVALFEQATRAVRADFAVTDENAEAVAELCVRLDGLPLAIELAAARGRRLSPAALLDRYSRRLDLLSDGPRDLPERQRTLRNTIAWSYDLLSHADQKAFRWLGVFAGGCVEETAEDLGLSSDTVRSLADKHLVRIEDDSRVWMLETVREFAQELLLASGEAPEAEARHTELFRDLAEQGMIHVTGPDQVAWLERFDAEYENVRSVFERAIRNGDAETGQRIASGMKDYWRMRGIVSEGCDWLKQALALDGGSPESRASALHALGQMTDERGERDAAEDLLRGALAAWRELDDERQMAAVMNDVAGVMRDRAAYEEAVRIDEEALAIHRRLGNARGIGISLNGLGMDAIIRGHYAQAADLFESSAAAIEPTGDLDRIALALSNAASLAYWIGENARSRRLAEQALAIRRRLRDPRRIGNSLVNLSANSIHEGNLDEAFEYLDEAVPLLRQVGEPRDLGIALHAMGYVHLLRKSWDRAACAWQRDWTFWMSMLIPKS